MAATAALLCFLGVVGPAATAAAPGVASGPGGPGGPDQPGDALTTRVAAILAAGPRSEGTEAAGRVADLVAAACRKSGAAVLRRGFGDSQIGYSESAIIEASFPGESADELVLALPLDTWYDDPPSVGAEALALALGEIERIGGEIGGGRRLPLGLRFLFLGAERRGPRPSSTAWQSGGEQRLGLGSALWAGGAGAAGRKVVVYLSFDALPSAIELVNASGNLLSPYWIYESSRKALAGSGFAYRLSSNRMQLHRLGLVAAGGPLGAWLGAELPAVELRSAKGAEAADAEAAPARFAAFLERLLADNAGGFPGTWDRHYVSFQVGRDSFVIREGPYVAFLVILASFFAGLILLRSLLHRGSARYLLKRIPVLGMELVLVFVAAAAAILAGNLLAAAEGLLFGSADWWRLSPLLFSLSHLVFAFGLFFSLHALFVALRLLPSDPGVEAAAAQGWLGIDVFVFAFAAPSLSFYFAWGFLVSELARLSRKRWSPIAALLLMYAPIHLVVAEMAARPEAAILGRLIKPGFLPGLLAAASAAPFLAYAAAAVMQGPRGGRRHHLRRSLGFALFGLGAWLACLVGLALLPRGGMPLRYSESIDLDGSVFEARIAAARRIPALELAREGKALRFGPGEGASTAEGSATGPGIDLELGRRSFLDRSNVDLVLAFAIPPDRVELELRGERDLGIADCSLPVSVSLDGLRATISAAERPGPRLRFRLTLPRSFEDRLLVRAHYLKPPLPVEAPPGYSLAYGSLELSRSFLLSAEAAP